VEGSSHAPLQGLSLPPIKVPDGGIPTFPGRPSLQGASAGSHFPAPVRAGRKKGGVLAPPEQQESCCDGCNNAENYDNGGHREVPGGSRPQFILRDLCAHRGPRCP